VHVEEADVRALRLEQLDGLAAVARLGDDLELGPRLGELPGERLAQERLVVGNERGRARGAVGRAIGGAIGGAIRGAIGGRLDAGVSTSTSRIAGSARSTAATRAVSGSSGISLFAPLNLSTIVRWRSIWSFHS
jgi:hypothetical protein